MVVKCPNSKVVIFFIGKSLCMSYSTWEPYYNDINDFAVFVKVISEVIFSCGVIEATKEQFARNLGLI